MPDYTVKRYPTTVGTVSGHSLDRPIRGQTKNAPDQPVRANLGRLEEEEECEPLRRGSLDSMEILGWLYETAYLGQCQSLTRKVPLGRP